MTSPTLSSALRGLGTSKFRFGAPPVTATPPPLHPAQQQVMEAAEREVILICGRRWGKTRLGAIKAVFGSPHHKGALQGGLIWWVAPTYAVAGIAWRFAKSLCRNMPGATFKEAERYIEFPSGGQVWFKSADRPENLRGEGLDGLIVDEADFIEGTKAQADGPTYHEVLRPALMDRRGWALLISTPNIEFGWLHQLYDAARLGRRPGARAFHYSSYENPFIAKEELDSLRASSPELAFRREILAEWVGAAGAMVKREWIKVGEPPPLEELSIVLGVDLAVSEKESADYTAIVVVGRHEASKTWWVLDAFRFRASFAKIQQAIENHAAAWRAVSIGIEANQFQMWLVQELRRNTTLPIVSVRADKDKPARFAPVAQRYEQGLVWHSGALPIEFTSEITAFPDSLKDDWADALAYALRLAGGASADYDWVSMLGRST